MSGEVRNAEGARPMIGRQGADQGRGAADRGRLGMDDRTRYNTDDEFNQRRNLLVLEEEGYNYDRVRTR